MSSIIFLGAPSNEALRRTWRPDFLLTEDDHTAVASNIALWRRLDFPGPSSLSSTDDSRVLDEDAANMSFALFRAQSPDMPAHTSQERAVDEESTADSSIPTQLPAFDFDMSSVLDVEDVYDQAVKDKNGRQLSYSMLAAVLNISPSRPILTRSGLHTEVVILTLGDATSNGFEMALWGSHAQYARQFLRRLDIVLFRDFVLSTFRDVLGGTSRQGRSSFTVLYRTERRERSDDRYRPLLLHDLQSSRVRTVRDWVLTWIPSETQPEETSWHV